MGLPLNKVSTPGISPHISSAHLRHSLHALHGSLLSSARGQEQSLGIGHWDNASAFLCFLLGEYSTSKSNLDRASIHLAALCFGSFQLNSHFRASWLECIEMLGQQVMLIVIYEVLYHQQLSISCVSHAQTSPWFSYYRQLPSLPKFGFGPAPPQLSHLRYWCQE